MLEYHAALLSDEVRTNAFLAALKQRVRPGSRVLDVGTGTGILALAAERLGADVVAVEAGDMIDYARAVARKNGSNVRFIHDDIRKLDPSAIEPVDTIVCEMIGNMLLDEKIISVMESARRFLKQEGIVIPSAVQLRVALVNSVPVAKAAAFWREKRYGFDFSALAECMEHYTFPDYLKPSMLLGPGSSLPEIDLMTATGDRFSGSCTLVADRSGECNAVLAWWSARLSPGVVLEEKPDEAWSGQHWFRTLFPVDSMPVSPGDAFPFSIEHDAAVPRGMWTWTLGSRRRSTFFQFPQTRERLMRVFGAD
ncbi:MAG: 50S ribosomal protein L11 methyltransferase [Candidatus Hydrogenedentota bacterium]